MTPGDPAAGDLVRRAEQWLRDTDTTYANSAPHPLWLPRDLVRELLAQLAATQKEGETAIHPSTVTDQPGRPVAAPCAISGRSYAELEAQLAALQHARETQLSPEKCQLAELAVLLGSFLGRAREDDGTTLAQAVRELLERVRQAETQLAVVQDAIFAASGMRSNHLPSDITSLIRVLRERQAHGAALTAALRELSQRWREVREAVDVDAELCRRTGRSVDADIKAGVSVTLLNCAEQLEGLMGDAGRAPGEG